MFSIKKTYLAPIVIVLVLSGSSEVFAANAPLILSRDNWFNSDGSSICGDSIEATCNDEPHEGGDYTNYYQCVELAQRFYKKQGWYNGVFAGVGIAEQIYTKADDLNFTRQANGSIDSIVPGDMIIHNSSFQGSKNAGHVALVDSVSGTNVYVVEQNLGTTGTTTYNFSNKTLKRTSTDTTVLGVVHSPKNTTKSDVSWISPYGNGAKVDTLSLRNNNWILGWSNTGWSAPQRVVSGNFDGQGYDDMAYTMSNGNNGTNMNVLTSNGTSWSNAWSTTNWTTPSHVVSGDFNGDKKDDLLWVMPSGTGTVNLNAVLSSGSGWYNGWTATGWTTPITVAAGDFSNDGKDDLLWVMPNGAGASNANVVLSTGSGWTNAWSVNGWASPTAIVTGKLEGNTFDNMVWVSPDSNGSHVNVFRPNGSGWSYLWSGSNWTNPMAVRVGDFDGNKDDDLLWVMAGGSGLANHNIVNSSGSGWLGSMSTTGWTAPSAVITGNFR